MPHQAPASPLPRLPWLAGALIALLALLGGLWLSLRSAPPPLPGPPPGATREVRADRNTRDTAPAIPSASPSSTPPVETPLDERAYWQRLEELRVKDPHAALAYALEGESWYGDVGKAAEGRKALIISLLVDLDRMEEARQRTRLFLAAYPQSSYAPLVQGLTGIHPRPGRPATP